MIPDLRITNATFPYSALFGKRNSGLLKFLWVLYATIVSVVIQPNILAGQKFRQT